MSAVHWRAATEHLTRIVGSPRFGLFSDLDGTLAPIAPTPDAAHISERARALLAEAQQALPFVALISGRRAASLQSKVGIDRLTYVGNHGLERWTNGQTVVNPAVEPYLSELKAVLADLRALEETGVHVEDKGATLSFHYRQAADPAAFATKNAARIGEIVDRHGLVLFEGKMVFEVRPPIDMDKGVAFLQLVSEQKLDAALFLGDDISDLSALQTAKRLRAEGICETYGVGIQSLDAPADLAATADFLADGVPDVEELLAWLLKARKASST